MVLRLMVAVEVVEVVVDLTVLVAVVAVAEVMPVLLDLMALLASNAKLSLLMGRDGMASTTSALVLPEMVYLLGIPLVAPSLITRNRKIVLSNRWTILSF